MQLDLFAEGLLDAAREGSGLGEILEMAVGPEFLISDRSVVRLYIQEGPKMFGRCASREGVLSTLSGAGPEDVQVRKLTPEEYERALGFPDDWTHLS